MMGNNRYCFHHAACLCFMSFLLHSAFVVVCGLSSSAAVDTGKATSRGNSMMPPFTKVSEHLPLAKTAMNYFDSSSDPFHAVQSSVDLLKEAGFEGLDDEVGRFGQKIVSGGKYFYTRNKSTLVAFAVGKKYAKGNGFKVVAGHTDSPNLRVKARSKRTSSKTIQLGVECYGGGLWHTWFDRDLGISGRVMVRNHDNNKIEQRLIKIDRALLRISNLAIHLQTAKEREAFKINKEDHLSPILAMEAKKALSKTVATTSSSSAAAATTMAAEIEAGIETTTNGESSSINGDAMKTTAGTETETETTTSTTASSSSSSVNGDADNSKDKGKEDGWSEYQEPILLQLLANELNIAKDDIVDFELHLFDVQQAALGGAYCEFIHSARLDNLASCFLAVQSLIDHVQEGCLADDEDISMIVLYDHEEVGSASAVGAASPILKEAVRTISSALNRNTNDEVDGSTGRIASGMFDQDLHELTISKSFILSSDQAHAIHPNYANKHEKNHQPKMNEGMVIKRNSNQRYATTGITGLIIREIAQKANLPPVQEFIVRQDCGCGSTIGPLMSTATGIRAIDMGCPSLSMHSIRETMGVCDLTNGLDLFKAFFRYFREVDSSVEQ